MHIVPTIAVIMSINTVLIVWAMAKLIKTYTQAAAYDAADMVESRIELATKTRISGAIRVYTEMMRSAPGDMAGMSAAIILAGLVGTVDPESMVRVLAEVALRHAEDPGEPEEPCELDKEESDAP